MDPEKKYDLSLLGDMRSKLIAILLAVVCFSTFIQSFLNQLHSTLGVSFTLGYIFFIFVYFIMPTILVSVFVHSNLRGLNKWKQLAVPGRNLYYLITLLLIAFGAFLLPFIGYVFIVISLLIIGMVITLAVIEIRKDGKVDKVEGEYLLITFIVLLIAATYFYKRIDTIKESQKVIYENPCSALKLYDFNYEIKDKLLSLSGKIDSYADVADAGKWNLDYAQAGLSGRYLRKDSALKNIIASDTLISEIFQSGHYFLGEGYKMMDSCNLDADSLIKSISAVDSCLKSYEKDISKRSANLKAKDTLLADTLRQQIDRYRYAVKVVSYSIEGLVKQSDIKLRKRWLEQTNYLQYIGLLWFFTHVIFLFTILYLFRVKERRLQRQGEEASRMIETLTNDDPDRSELKDRIHKNAQQVQIVQESGNKAKNLLLLFLMLIAPYFKDFNENNISLERPLLNFDLQEIVTGRPVGDYSSSGGKKLSDTSIVRFTNIDSIRVIADTLKIDSQVFNQQEVLNKLKDLGRKTIDNTTDRNEYIESFPEKHKP